MNQTDKTAWQCADAAALYGVDRWGADYFGVAASGELVVKAPTSAGPRQVPLMEIVEGLRGRGLEMPVMLRLENLVDDRITALNQGFAKAIEQSGYGNCYRGVFPIKVNQQSHVVAEIARFGKRFHHGLEAGSKAELLIAMATLEDRDSLIVCNGYKDEEFVDLGLQARKLGFRCFFVIETPKELPLIVARSRHWGVSPLIGVRLKMATQVDGHWSKDSGDRSLFGLSTTQLIHLVDSLKAEGMLDCLQLLHFHLGSQIPSIRNIRDGVREACRYYIDLVNEGAPLGYFDLGGGLAVDYDGTASDSGHSRNYSLEEYCVDIVEAVQESLNPQGIAHPVIVTESGRATVAPMSVLLFNILDVGHFTPEPCSEKPQMDHESIRHLWEALQAVTPDNLQESYNDALYYRDQMREFFHCGQLNLRVRAQGENLCLSILQRVAELAGEAEPPLPPALENLREQLAEIYYGNFSVFQSLPDAWAIEQVFPVMPIHRLAEEPTCQAVIADLTCDCDGKLDRFVGAQGETRTLPLHPLNDGEEYYLGVFLVGAYQETLGDLHNLFGDTNVASVRLNGDGQLEFMHELQGDSIADVLSYVEYQPGNLYQQFRATAEAAVQDSRISVKERQQMLGLFNDSLRGYTYFER